MLKLVNISISNFEKSFFYQQSKKKNEAKKIPNVAVEDFRLKCVYSYSSESSSPESSTDPRALFTATITELAGSNTVTPGICTSLIRIE